MVLIHKWSSLWAGSAPFYSALRKVFLLCPQGAVSHIKGNKGATVSWTLCQQWHPSHTMDCKTGVFEFQHRGCHFGGMDKCYVKRQASDPAMPTGRPKTIAFCIKKMQRVLSPLPLSWQMLYWKMLVSCFEVAAAASHSKNINFSWGVGLKTFLRWEGREQKISWNRAPDLVLWLIGTSCKQCIKLLNPDSQLPPFQCSSLLLLIQKN